jgi:hypothetical protein
VARFVTLQPRQLGSGYLRVEVGDLLILPAVGGYVRNGSGSMKLLGVFMSAVVGTNGEVLSPAGLPNVVAFRACRVGSATIEVLLPSPGMPSETSESRILEITVTD